MANADQFIIYCICSYTYYILAPILSNALRYGIVKESVCFPYEFTLLSNMCNAIINIGMFVSPTNLHCSQTMFGCFLVVTLFVSPTNLHCSQTCRVYYFSGNRFVSPTNLHCSQTEYPFDKLFRMFVSPTNLHCSQTYSCALRERR